MILNSNQNILRTSRRMLALGCLEKWSFRSTSSLYSKFYPRNISYMPAVKFFVCLDFERKSLFFKTPIIAKRMSHLHAVHTGRSCELEPTPLNLESKNLESVIAFGWTEPPQNHLKHPLTEQDSLLPTRIP
jgi:hypothetical protein